MRTQLATACTNDAIPWSNVVVIGMGSLLAFAFMYGLYKLLMDC